MNHFNPQLILPISPLITVGSVVDIFAELEIIQSRLQQIDSVGEWIARETVHNDLAISQSGSYLCAMTSDLQMRVESLIVELQDIVKMISDSPANN
jgi:hypothetical protein